MKTIDREFTKTEEIQNQLSQEINKKITNAIISQLPDVPLIGNYVDLNYIVKGRYYCETQPYGGVCLESYYVPFISMGVCCNA